LNLVYTPFWPLLGLCILCKLEARPFCLPKFLTHWLFHPSCAAFTLACAVSRVNGGNGGLDSWLLILHLVFIFVLRWSSESGLFNKFRTCWRILIVVKPAGKRHVH
jgi:hypothetical protein